MNCSAVIITTNQSSFDLVVSSLTATGLEIAHIDRDSARLVAVIEAETTTKEADIFNQIRQTPGVVDVSLVNHFFEDEA